MIGRPSTPRPRGHLARGLLLSFFLHANVIAPIVIATWVLARREEAQKAEEVDVAFEDVKPEELPHDLPPLDNDPLPEPSARDKAKTRVQAEPPKKPTEEKPPVPTPEKKPESPPPVPEMAAPPPPAPQAPPPPKLHEKVVDLDNDKDVEPPKDAKLLAQKNNRADIETRDDRTNLSRAQKGEEASATTKPNESPPDPKTVGDSRDHIAELDDVKSKAGRSAPEATPRRTADSAETPDDRPLRSPVLSLRNAAPRGHEITPETADPSLPRDPAGMLSSPHKKGAFRDDEAAHDHVRSGKQVKLSLVGKDYEYLFGSEAKADRQLAQKTRSTRMGKFAKRTAQIRSALENFLPEVRPGNQTALNTRAAPFAEFIARMHREIHKLWGFGILEEWDDLPRASPYNNESLASTLEIVLAGDGTIDKVSVIKASGYVAYDAAAVDVVYTAAPFPEPPPAIRSGNGKIYIHWSFFRDGRQCATSGVDYFILNNAPAEGSTAQGQSPSHEAEGDPTVDQGAGLRAAQAWFSDYVKGDVNRLANAAIFPFRTSLTAVAKTRDELSGMLRSLFDESSRRTSGEISLETAAGLRKHLGKLPPGADDGSGALFAVSRSGNETLVLILKRTQRGFQPQGLLRL